MLYRKLRRISYKAKKNATRGSHCGGKEFVASRPAAGGESCDAGFYFNSIEIALQEIWLVRKILETKGLSEKGKNAILSVGETH